PHCRGGVRRILRALHGPRGRTRRIVLALAISAPNGRPGAGLMTSKTGTHLDLRRCVPMTREEEHRCATEYARTKSPVLAARLVAANMRLVVKIAHGYRRPQYDVSD